MALLTQQRINATGIEPTYAAAAGGGDTCSPGGFLHFKNGDSNATTVTLVTPGTVEGRLAVEDQELEIAAGDEAMILVGDEYRNPATGLASITYSSATSLTVGYFR